MATAKSKLCRCCNQEKALERFNKCASAPDRLQYTCRDCFAARHAAKQSVRVPRTCAICQRLLPADQFRPVKNRQGLVDCRDCERTVLRCARCLVVKPYAEFAPDKRQSTGCKSFCRACDAAHQKVARKSRDYKDKRRQYRSRPDIKAKDREYLSRYAYQRRRIDPLFKQKEMARSAVNKAVRNGWLLRARRCEGKGKYGCQCSSGRLTAHHHKGYDQEHWLDVEWLCLACHRAADAVTAPAP